MACRSAQPDVVELLVTHGADVSVRDRAGNTPLHCAAESDCLSAAKTLLDAGADPNAGEAYWGWSPLHVAAGTASIDLLQLLVDYGASMYKLSKVNPRSSLCLSRAANALTPCVAVRAEPQRPH